MCEQSIQFSTQLLYEERGGAGQASPQASSRERERHHTRGKASGCGPSVDTEVDDGVIPADAGRRQRNRSSRWLVTKESPVSGCCDKSVDYENSPWAIKVSGDNTNLRTAEESSDHESLWPEKSLRTRSLLTTKRVCIRRV